jgi:hypothetical protein
VPAKIAAIVTFVVSAILLGLYCNCHVVYGGGAGLKLCKKDGLSLTDTFVDLGSVPASVMNAEENAGIRRALVACGALPVELAPAPLNSR